MRRGGACVPTRTSAQRRFHTKNIRIMHGEFNDGCALVGRHGRAHRHRPYQTPSYFFHTSHTNQITIYMQSAPTASTVPHAICPNETVGAAPVCPPERPRSGVSIQKNTRIMHGEFNDGYALVGRRGRAHRHRPYQSPPNRKVCHYRVAVILSIAQGWQVQRSLPWVTMQARRLPPWGLYFFQHIAF